MVDQGMPDESHWNSGVPVDFLLEGEDHKHLRDIAFDVLNATPSPRPELGRDVIDNRNIETLEFTGEPQIEVTTLLDDQKAVLVLVQEILFEVLKTEQTRRPPSK